MEHLQEQLAKIEQDLSAEKQKGPEGDQIIIARLESEQAHTLEQIMLANQAKEQQEREQGHVERVAVIADKFDSFLDHMDLGGMTLRQVIGGESEYQLASIGLKKEYTGQADYFSKQIVELQAVHSEQSRASQEREIQLQRQNDELQKEFAHLQKTHLDYVKLQYEIVNDLDMAKADAEKKRDNAVEALDLAQIEIKRLNSHIDDLRNEIALGARGAINVVDTAEEERQKKELADRIRKERTIYNKEWANPIKKDKFKAQKAIDGEYFEFPWTEETKYFVIEEAEVQQFREQYGVQSTDQIPSVVETSIPNGVNQEATFRSAPNVGSVHAPELATGNVSGESAHQQVAQKTDTRSEIEQRVEILEQSNLEMQTWIDSIEKRVGKMDGLDSYNNDEVA